MDERVVLYSRGECHLCDDAREVIVRVCEDSAVTWTEVDVDSDVLLRSRYGDEVPVVAVDGAVIGFWRIHEDQLREALARSRGQ